ncbi:hypothetical protein [Pedobacter aquatilis]|uniref:hypothetical protein n=1 Tax=Pedobacter aquatilis TaxID=351343 RepID=UPI002931566D|nr:hypothetical protein [Pedobacter aquatilis]
MINKGLLIILVSLLFTSTLVAQEAQNIADLDFLYKKIQELHSYKDQLKGNKSYKKLYEGLRKNLKSSDEFEIYQSLLRMIYPIRDNHLGLWRKPDSSLRFKYLKLEIDTTQIESRYNCYPKDSIEGIYARADGARYILHRERENVYYLQNFRTGIVEIILNDAGNKSFDAINFMSPPVPYVLYRNVRLVNGKLGNMNFQKFQPDKYAPIKFGKEKFEYRELKSKVGYLRLSSFSTSSDNHTMAKSFFDIIKAKLIPECLIVDLRNNLGGGYRTSKQFLTFLKKYRGQIYLLQNNNTMSNAEQFILDLKGKSGLLTLGEATRGTITYGSNYGKAMILPSKRFIFYPTDMRGRSRDLAYENIGIKPNILLDPFGDDWITQTIKHIEDKINTIYIK